jgi:hydrogenase maturation factor HypF (carbamoyltransferase family)
VAKFNVYATVTGSKYIGEFEADSKEAAEEMAWKEADVSICHQCSKEIEDPEVTELVVEEVEEADRG